MEMDLWLQRRLAALLVEITNSEQLDKMALLTSLAHSALSYLAQSTWTPYYACAWIAVLGNFSVPASS